MKSAITALLVAFALIVYLMSNGGVSAHDHSRPDLDDWFKGLQSKGFGSCCDGSDQKGLADPDWRSQNGKYQVRLKDEWIDVPDDAVVEGQNKVGHAMVWPVVYEDGTIVIRCFMPGAMT